MSIFYELVGRIVVAVVRRRFGRQLRTASALLAVGAAVGVGLWLAGRDVQEG